MLALATFALADTIVKERISTWLREPFVVENADHRPVSPEGRGLRRVVGELLTCTRCTGTWSALALVALRTASPVAGKTTANVLALAPRSGDDDPTHRPSLLVVDVVAVVGPRPRVVGDPSAARRRRGSVTNILRLVGDRPVGGSAG